MLYTGLDWYRAQVEVQVGAYVRISRQRHRERRFCGAVSALD
jgi:hypothetical protein